MRATIHVIPAAGVDAEAHAGARRCGSGIATAALQTAERFGPAADLVLVAVPAGQGAQLAAYLQHNGAVASGNGGGDR